MFKDKEAYNKYMREYMQRGRQDNPDKYRKQHRKYKTKLKVKVFAQYGNACNGCGSTVQEILELNHLNGGGCQERKRIGRNGYGIYRNALKEPSKYNLLCRICNALHYVSDILGIKGYKVTWKP
jgi:hypothetical protein